MKEIHQLKNGATVIAKENGVALAMWEKSQGVEYAVWNVDREGNAENGSYSRDFLVAVAKFEERSA